MNNCRTKHGTKLNIALCIVVKYIHGKQVIYLYRNIYAVKLKFTSNVLHSNEAAHITDEMNKKGY